ncbi:alpha/beta fold hydrolase [Spiroplasma floricola]|uniref:Lysophospholipase n=1 Tax=Spiroplasma floricola 23-6 TaxID=1336749 RepID=A0A2K8SF38_9MOLU|nr:alpha/beta fold hydrolase [Spiroplasma floricola]AUB32052.1 lysophospholipase [Spiroplasma floricola 23-6]
MKELLIKGHEGKNLYTYIWEDVKTVKGILQLVHGSCEHSKRYDEFAKFLNANGWVVISNDHRGHGKTADLNNNELGYFADKDGWDILVKDLKKVNDYIKQNYKNQNIVMLGHSMGSFLARSYAIDFSETIQGLILSGTAWQSNLALKFGRKIAISRQKKYGSKNIDKFIWNLSYKKFNKKFNEKSSTGMEWLSIDENNVKKFIEDPLCGQIFTTSAFKDLFEGLIYIQNNKNIKKIRKDLPIILVSGSNDPVGNYSKSVKKTYKKFKKAKLNTKLKLYENLRHEILFDINKKEIFVDTLSFLNSI